MKDGISDLVDLPAVPFFNGIGIKGIMVLVIAIDEEGSEVPLAIIFL